MMMLSAAAHANVVEEVHEQWTTSSHFDFNDSGSLSSCQSPTGSLNNVSDLITSSSFSEEDQQPALSPLSTSHDTSSAQVTALSNETATVEGEDDGNSPVELRCKRRILEKRVSFPTDESLLVRNLEPPEVPETVPEPPPTEDNCINLIATYSLSCKKNETEPVANIIEQLKSLDLTSPHTATLTLRGLTLDSHDCESLEEVLKTSSNVAPLKLLDLGASHTNDDGLIALFDMIEFYEAASHVSIAANKNMTSRGWQACCRMIKRTECLEWLDAAQVALSEHSATLLARALRSNSQLRILQLNGCNLAGRSLAIIASSLKMNRNLRELHLAENKLTAFDALQLGILLTGNKSLQHIDLRNNEIADKGIIYLCDALMDNTGLDSLVVWNNGITAESCPALAKVLASNQSLRTLNLGYNRLADDGLAALVASGLERNRWLLHLGLQENNLTCCGVISLAESIANGTRMQRIDLRKNKFQLAGLMALAAALKLCPTVTCLDLDDNFTTSDDLLSAEYERLINEIGECCSIHDQQLADAAGVGECDTVGELKCSLNGETQGNNNDFTNVVSRKISLTCATPLAPPSTDADQLTLPINNKTSDQDKANGNGRLRSPLPSPSPSPLPSPLPSPSPSCRFKVTRVGDDEPADPLMVESPLPSPRSRFTVTPVSTTSPSPVETSPNSSSSDLIRSSPSKVVIGFDVLSK